MIQIKPEETVVSMIGRNTVKSPLHLSNDDNDGVYNFIQDNNRVVYDASLDHYKDCLKNKKEPVSFEVAGPHEKIYFDPSKTKVAIVTCGGLCPGLNVVIRSLVRQLYYVYKVNRIVGIRYGYEGFIPSYNHPIMELTPEVVENIYMYGGTILGSSRGNQDVSEIVDALERMNINILFAVGGDGTLRGAYQIHEEILKRGLKIAVGGVPKTIDNDINLIEKSFGFETAVTEAFNVISNAHNEAQDAYNGIALVKLMGRDSGFIAAHAALSIQEVNFVLVPELYFDLYGRNGFLAALKKRLEEKKHAVVVVAEGAGQHLFEGQEQKYDASGNKIHNDIGLYLKDVIQEEFTRRKMRFTIKYIDPSYLIRSAPAIATDSKFCNQLAQMAVHAAMAGKTGFVVGNWNNQFTLLPIPLAVKERKKIDLESDLWLNVLEATRQPTHFKND